MAVTATTDTEHLQYVLDVLAVTAEAELVFEDAPFLWHVKDGRAVFYMACSDAFAWGCADGEEIASDDIPLLRQTLTDLKAAGDYSEMWLGPLFCARKRGMRPMNRWMKVMREKEGLGDAAYELFCTAGPERESVWMAP